MCTIAGIDTDWAWFYISCRVCNKKCIMELGIKVENTKTPPHLRLRSEVCGNYTRSITPRYKLHLHIHDHSGESKCMLFDSHALSMIGYSSAELLDGACDELEDPSAIDSKCTKSWHVVLKV